MIINSDVKKLFIINNEKDMRCLADKLAELSFKGMFVALFGGLGAGKTTFVKGFCLHYGIDEVSSPTFTIVKHYEGGGERINHFDCYRLESSDELLAIGFEEYLYSRSIILMEWSENVCDALPNKRLELHIAGSGSDTRTVELISFGSEYDAILEGIFL